MILLVGAVAAGFYIGQQNSVERTVVSNEIERPAFEEPASSEAGLQTTSQSSAESKQVLAEKPEVGTPGLIAENLEKTQQWLADAKGKHFSIQLFMSHISDRNKVEAFLEESPEMLDFNKIYIYETVVKGHNWYNVLYNDFATQGEAIDTLNALPPSLQVNDPYLRRVSILKKENALYR